MSHKNAQPQRPQNAASPPAPDLIPYEIPVEGSLGLLAVGYRGLLAWREIRDAAGKTRAAPDDNA